MRYPTKTPQITVDRPAIRLAGNTSAIANTEAVAQRCPVKRMLVFQNSQEDTCARVYFLINLQVPACNFIKKETGTGVFL